MRTSKFAQLSEILLVFCVALAVILIAGPRMGDHPLARSAVILVANLLMLVAIWAGLRLRGQTCGHFGLSFRLAHWRAVTRALFQSLVTFVIAVAAFVTGAVLMANIVGIPDGADMSGYHYLRGDLKALIVTLAAAYLVASFGEEVIYRGFLINRIAELGSGSAWAWKSAVVISSLIFGLVHSDWAITGMVQAGFMGFVLGVSYLVVRRNLWVTILAHGQNVLACIFDWVELGHADTRAIGNRDVLDGMPVC